ncbi:MAG: molybdopterin-dependent oxidoreductase, partial [Rhodobacteraceae bacterium]|nr:molybdopterin-dependent oxidoreductase [Paracoccaceae bacterium]
MAHRWKNDLTSADVTPRGVWLNRRNLIAGMGAAAGLGAIGAPLAAQEALEPNSWEEITGYNNFYEFGTRKDDPAKYAHMMTTEPWSIEINGMVDRPGRYNMTDIMAQMELETRIYRFRCVEAWSMIIPWTGFELADLLDLAGVQEGAQYVAFETLLRPEEMPGVRYPVIDWP